MIRPRRHALRRRARVAAGALALLASAAAPALATTGPTAQLAGGELFMGTTKVEVGARANGSFGSTGSAPAGYSPLTQTGTILGFRVNPNECAWTDGACVTLGDFFTPGVPYESWGLQIGNGTPAFNSNSTSDVAGAFTSADSAGASGVWQSSSPFGSAINVTQRYAIPAYAWMIDTTVELTNTSGSTVNDVYFMRGLDPDNCRMEARVLCDSDGNGTADVAGVAGSGVYKTHNTIVSQGSAAASGLVTATQTNDSYVALRAISSDARVLVKNSGFSNPSSIAALWNDTDTAFRSTLATSFADTGIYAVVRVPSIAPGATATLRLQYVVKEIPAAADLTEAVPAAGGLIDVAARNPAGAVLRGVCAGPAHGTATIEGGKVRYVPSAGFSGTDSFSYSTGGPCGTVTVTVSAAALAPAPARAPVVLLAPAKRTTMRSGVLRLAQRLQLNGIGRYTFIYTDPATGKRVKQLRGSSLGSRRLTKRFNAPVITTKTAGRNVVLSTVFDRRLPARLRRTMTLRIILKSPDGTISDVTPR